MLVLTRERGQRIRLDLGDGRYVWIDVKEGFKRGSTKIAIEAPQSVRIHREELLTEEERRCAGY